MAISVVIAAGLGDFGPIAKTVEQNSHHFRVVHVMPLPGNALGVLRRTRPRLFLMGMEAADTPSLELIRTIADELPTRLVVMCRTSNAGDAVQALIAGAAGYVLTDTEDDDVVRLLKVAAA